MLQGKKLNQRRDLEVGKVTMPGPQSRVNPIIVIHLIDEFTSAHNRKTNVMVVKNACCCTTKSWHVINNAIKSFMQTAECAKYNFIVYI